MIIVMRTIMLANIVPIRIIISVIRIIPVTHIAINNCYKYYYRPDLRVNNYYNYCYIPTLEGQKDPPGRPRVNNYYNYCYIPTLEGQKDPPGRPSAPSKMKGEPNLSLAKFSIVVYY